MTLPQSLTREEAQRQIAELQRHIESLPTNNHPCKLEKGMIFKHNASGRVFISHPMEEGGMSSGRFRLVELIGTAGNSWNDRGFGHCGPNHFIYLGHAKDLLVLKADKPEVVVTDEMLEHAYDAFANHDGGVKVSLKHVLTLAFNGKL